MDFNYFVIGGGPSGYCAVARLIEKNINNICWIDPFWNFGEFGNILNVPGNTKVSSFLNVLNQIEKITGIPRQKTALDKMNPNETCLLKFAYEAFQNISFGDKITKITGKVSSINITHDDKYKRIFEINTDEKIFNSENVVLAIGSIPKSFPLKNKIILDELKIFNSNFSDLPTDKRIAVIGSSHSAALASMNLLKMNYKVTQYMNKPYNFYEVSDGKVKFANNGLKGDVAIFTKNILDKNDFSKNINYVFVDNLTDVDEEYVVFCIGYQRRFIKIYTENNDFDFDFNLNYNGMIIPGLFGVGIAFPRKYVDEFGENQTNVGIEKFWNDTFSIF